MEEIFCNIYKEYFTQWPLNWVVLWQFSLHKTRWKYIKIYIYFNMIKKKFVCLTKSCPTILAQAFHSSTTQTYGTKTPKKCCHVGILEGTVWRALSVDNLPSCELRAAKFSLSIDQIARILCPLHRRPSCEVTYLYQYFTN